MTNEIKLQKIDAQFAHIWMVRTFLKHSDEAESDEQLCEVYRSLYDIMHALGPSYAAGDADVYLRQLRKKLPKLKKAAELFAEIQPEVSGHTNFLMARRSLESAITNIVMIMEDC